jgi:hypothetical protein
VPGWGPGAAMLRGQHTPWEYGDNSLILPGKLVAGISTIDPAEMAGFRPANPQKTAIVAKPNMLDCAQPCAYIPQTFV